MILLITIIGVLVLAIGFLLWRLRVSNLANSALQHKVSMVEYCLGILSERVGKVEKSQEEELSQDQLDYKDKLQAQYAVLFQKIQEDFKAEVKTVKSDAVGTVQKAKGDFDKLLKAEFEKACEKIKFDEIEYKKTITKKRKEYNRKNSHKAKPQKIWRSIMDE